MLANSTPRAHSPYDINALLLHYWPSFFSNAEWLHEAIDCSQALHLAAPLPSAPRRLQSLLLAL